MCKITLPKDTDLICTYILILDIKASVQLGMDAIDLCIANGIDLVALPPKLSWLLQPLDQMFAELKYDVHRIASEGRFLHEGEFLYKASTKYKYKV